MTKMTEEEQGRKAKQNGRLFGRYMKIMGKRHDLTPTEYARFMGLYESWEFFSTRRPYDKKREIARSEGF